MKNETKQNKKRVIQGSGKGLNSGCTSSILSSRVEWNIELEQLQANQASNTINAMSSCAVCVTNSQKMIWMWFLSVRHDSQLGWNPGDRGSAITPWVTLYTRLNLTPTFTSCFFSSRALHKYRSLVILNVIPSRAWKWKCWVEAMVANEKHALR